MAQVTLSLRLMENIQQKAQDTQDWHQLGREA